MCAGVCLLSLFQWSRVHASTQMSLPSRNAVICVHCWAADFSLNSFLFLCPCAHWRYLGRVFSRLTAVDDLRVLSCRCLPSVPGRNCWLKGLEFLFCKFVSPDLNIYRNETNPIYSSVNLYKQSTHQIKIENIPSSLGDHRASLISHSSPGPSL